MIGNHVTVIQCTCGQQLDAQIPPEGGIFQCPSCGTHLQVGTQSQSEPPAFSSPQTLPQQSAAPAPENENAFDFGAPSNAIVSRPSQQSNAALAPRYNRSHAGANREPAKRRDPEKLAIVSMLAFAGLLAVSGLGYAITMATRPPAAVAQSEADGESAVAETSQSTQAQTAGSASPNQSTIPSPATEVETSETALGGNAESSEDLRSMESENSNESLGSESESESMMNESLMEQDMASQNAQPSSEIGESMQERSLMDSTLAEEQRRVASASPINAESETMMTDGPLPASGLGADESSGEVESSRSNMSGSMGQNQPSDSVLDKTMFVSAFMSAKFGRAREQTIQQRFVTGIPLQIHVVDPNPKSSCITLYTTGMAAHRMRNGIRAELMIQLPRDWNLNSMADPGVSWPFSWLMLLGQYPQLNGAEYKTPATFFTSQERPRPIPGRKFSSLMIVDEFKIPTVDEPVHMMRVAPVYADEVQYDLDNDLASTITLLRNAGALGVVDVDRASAVR